MATLEAVRAAIANFAGACMSNTNYLNNFPQDCGTFVTYVIRVVLGEINPKPMPSGIYAIFQGNMGPGQASYTAYDANMISKGFSKIFSCTGAGETFDKSKLLPGDIIGTYNGWCYNGEYGVGHVAVYIGNGKQAQANSNKIRDVGSVAMVWRYSQIPNSLDANTLSNLAPANYATTANTTGTSASYVNNFINSLRQVAKKYPNYVGEGNGSNEVGCSDYVRLALIDAGIGTSSEINEATLWAGQGRTSYLDNSPLFTKTSFSSYDELQAGDILWANKSHVAVWAGDNSVWEAAPISDHGSNLSTNGTGVGLHKNHRWCCANHTWDWVYRLVGGSSSSPATSFNFDLDTKGYTFKEREVTTYEPSVSYIETTKDITYDKITTADSSALQKTKSTNLLSTNSLVETPFVILKVGNYTFGSYKQYKNKNNILAVDFPNYIDKLEVVKVNGSVNQYTISLTYQIQYGDNPNLLDEIFSTVGYGTVYISYGDWSAPTFAFREESALITDLTSNVNFSASRITYTVKCTSNAVALAATSFTFGQRHAKPSDVIKEMMYLSGNRYGLNDVFPGMVRHKTAAYGNWLASDDKEVTIEAKTSIDPISYINYLVTCMIPNTSADDSNLVDASYYMTINDAGEGAYFRIVKVSSTQNTLASYDTYEVDIGYPDIANTSGNKVIDFRINNANSWALLYKYSEDIKENNYVYRVDNNGIVQKEFSPIATTSSSMYRTTPSLKTWWSNMTQFPITATLTIKGLCRATMLMTYIRVNALFYGQRHSSSGLYVVTKEEDSISSSGYRTTLTLTRIAGDNDYITRTTETVKHKLPVVTYKTSKLSTKITEGGETGYSIYNVSGGIGIAGVGDSYPITANSETVSGMDAAQEQALINSTYSSIPELGRGSVISLLSSTFGLSSEAAKAVLVMIASENNGWYTANQNNFYIDYLYGCVAIYQLINIDNGDAESLYSRMSGWGGTYYARYNLLNRYENQLSQDALKAVYLACKRYRSDVYSACGVAPKPNKVLLTYYDASGAENWIGML